MAGKHSAGATSTSLEKAKSRSTTISATKVASPEPTSTEFASLAVWTTPAVVKPVGLDRIQARPSGVASKKTRPTDKKMRSKRSDKQSASGAALGVDSQRNLQRLQESLRRRRWEQEAKPSQDLAVLKVDAEASADSSEVQAVNSLQLGNFAKLASRVSTGTPQSRKRAPKLQIVRRLDNSLVVEASAAGLLAIRHASPGLKIFPATYAYPQRLVSLGDELEGAEIQVQPGAKSKKFSVEVKNDAGEPVAGVPVRALVDWDGAHVASKTDASGIAGFSIPIIYPEVVLLMVEPEHTYWSLFSEGFKRTQAPALLPLTIHPLQPDQFQLFEHYAAYDESAGAGVTVGVIDSGVGPHKDLTVADGAVIVTGEEGATDFQDNGIGHGTHVAGIIAAKKSAGGTYGLAPGAKIISYRVCPKVGKKGRAASVDIAAAIERAVTDGCHLINISMGSVEAMPEVPDMLEKARKAGVVVFAATGNDGKESLRYPARYSGTQAVGALGRDDTYPDDCPASSQESEVRRKSEWVAEFSNYGIGTDFIGPGVVVLSTYPKDRYAMMSGTSMATPFTTGMAARLLSANMDVLKEPDGPKRADAIIQLLLDNMRTIGWSASYGAGVLR